MTFWTLQIMIGMTVLGLVGFNTDFRVSPSKNTHPSAYLQDVVAYLTTVVKTTLEDLDQDIKSLVYFESLDHLATSLKVCHVRVFIYGC
jgi:hypothetical protein